LVPFWVIPLNSEFFLTPFNFPPQYSIRIKTKTWDSDSGVLDLESSSSWVSGLSSLWFSFFIKWRKI
jgi:hypothetical protein